MKVFLIVSQIVYGLFFAVWFTVWALSSMLFDSGVTPAAVTVFCIISAYPVAAIGCSIVAWIFYRKRKKQALLIVNLVPALWVVAVLGLLAFVGFQTA